MALVYKGKCSVALSQLVDLVKRSDVAIHREHTIGDNDTKTAVLGLLEHLLKNLHVEMLVAKTACLAKTDSVNNASMVQLVRDNGIFGGQRRLEEASIRVEATRVKDSIVELVEVSNFTFEFLVDVLRATDEANGRHSEAMSVHDVLSSLDNSGMVGESEVIVGAEVDHTLSVGVDNHILGTRDHTLRLVSACLLHHVDLSLADGLQGYSKSTLTGSDKSLKETPS